MNIVSYKVLRLPLKSRNYKTLKEVERMKTKIAKVIKKEQSKNFDYMTHYTLIYRGREYTITEKCERQNIFEVGDNVVIDTYKEDGYLCVTALYAVYNSHTDES